MDKNKRLELAKKWIEALRSGKYKQGEGQLVGVNKFCCLGVLCDVVKDEFNLTISDYEVHVKRGKSYDTEPSKGISKYFGLDKSFDKHFTIQEKLINMNDGNTVEDQVKETFKTIAKFLETEWLPTLEK